MSKFRRIVVGVVWAAVEAVGLMALLAACHAWIDSAIPALGIGGCLSITIIFNFLYLSNYLYDLYREEYRS